MIYSNSVLRSEAVKLPSMPEGYVWFVFSEDNGSTSLGLVLDGERTEFVRKLRMPDVVDEDEQVKIIQRAASSIRWDYVTAYIDEYMAEDEAAENIIHAENRFPLKKFA